MTTSLPAIEQYERLLPVARNLYEHTAKLSWQMLLPLFLVSVAISYSTELGITGSILVRLKRLIIVALLLVSFPTIAELCQGIGVELAKAIDDMSGIDLTLDAAAKRAALMSLDLQTILNLGNDLLLGVLVRISFVILSMARFFLLAFQHFYWLLLVVLGPFMILGTLFDAAASITKGLFKSMFQVSCWPIVWSVLSAFLKAIPFASAYQNQEELATIITLNLIIAIALLLSPFIISQLSEGVSLSVGDTLRRGVLNTVGVVSPKGLVASKIASAAGKVAGTDRLGRS